MEISRDFYFVWVDKSPGKLLNMREYWRMIQAMWGKGLFLAYKVLLELLMMWYM